jgi:isopenicillin N synthase-like dioxygenase
LFVDMLALLAARIADPVAPLWGAATAQNSATTGRTLRMSPQDSDGIRATTNLDHQRFEQVDKDKVYFHAEQASEQFEEDTRLETLSLRQLQKGSAEQVRAFGEALGRGMADIGFVYLTDHGIDPALFEEADRRTREFFEQTPEAEKLRFLAQRSGSVNQGYFPYKKSTAMHPDLVEGWVFASRAFNLDGRPDADGELERFWPDLADERFYRRLYQALEPLAIPLMRSILAGFGCPADLYDERLTDTLCALRLNYYPGLTVSDEELGAARLLGHEDVTLFTFLPASPVEGLQVFNRKSGRWIRLIPPPGTIIVNAGDYLQRITNNVFQSSTHRVSPPRDAAARRRPRTSFPLFVYLRETDRLEVLPCFEEPRYEPIEALTFHTNITRKFYGEAYRDTGSDD